MSWWEIILFIAVVIFAIYAFASIVGFRTRTLTRPTDRTAENMYDDNADSLRKQRRYARPTTPSLVVRSMSTSGVERSTPAAVCTGRAGVRLTPRTRTPATVGPTVTPLA